MFGGKLPQGSSFVATHGLWAGIPLGFSEARMLIADGLRGQSLSQVVFFGNASAKPIATKTSFAEVSLWGG